jgi:hypothetical protein
MLRRTTERSRFGTKIHSSAPLLARICETGFRTGLHQAWQRQRRCPGCDGLAQDSAGVLGHSGLRAPVLYSIAWGVRSSGSSS